MLQIERQKAILDFLETHPSTTIKELAVAVFASEASVRRDIAALESQGYVERIYGGVLLAGHKNSIIPVGLRDISHPNGKELVAQQAAERVQDGDTIILDASTTVFRMCRHLRSRKRLTIITNSLRVCSELEDCENIRLICTGGTYYGRNGCFLGAAAEDFLQNINADLLFFSSLGITADGRITDVSEEEVSMRRQMLRHAKKKYFLCDSSKFGVCKPFTLCTKDSVDEIICDAPLAFKE
ncbi:MAG: DeoR/GlpR transcriptional regulator [Clostridia bacterium]|nr:DeoR/GlpR transcriptional regulator [Clostridia bacterium]